MAETVSTLAALPLSVTASVLVAVGRDGDAAGVAVRVAPFGGIERLAADGDVSAAGTELTVPLVAVMEAEPEKFGDVLCPLPVSVAELVVIVYVPAGSAWPLRVRPSVRSA